jgi:hypothetical protein
MLIRGRPNGARHTRPQAGRDHPEQVVAINREAWSRSIGIAGRDHSVRAPLAGRLLHCELKAVYAHVWRTEIVTVF